MKTVIAVKPVIQKPERSDNHYLINEVIADLGITGDQILKMNKIVEKLYHEVGGDIPKIMRAIPNETSDPVEIAFLNYSLAFELVEYNFMRAISDMMKEAMQTGARIAIEQIQTQSGSPEAMSPGPVLSNINPAPADRMYG